MTRFLFSATSRIAVILMLVGFASFAKAEQPAPSIATFDAPAAMLTYPTAINSAGQITGYFQDATSTHGFVRDRKGTVVAFDPPGSNYTFPTAISSDGQITGYYANLNIYPSVIYHGFVRGADGTMLSFDVPAPLPSPLPDYYYVGIFPAAINSAGLITGYYVTPEGFLYGFLREPDGTITPITDDPSDPGHPGFCGSEPCWANLYPQAISANGEITGLYSLSKGADAYGYGFLRKRDGTIIRFRAAPYVTKMSPTSPYSINPEGQITGTFASPAGGLLYGFLRQRDGTFVTFDADPGNVRWTYPTAINAPAQITGYYTGWTNCCTYHGFLRERDGTIVTFDVPAATDTQPTAMNNSGDVTGWYSDSSYNVHGFVRKH